MVIGDDVPFADQPAGAEIADRLTGSGRDLRHVALVARDGDPRDRGGGPRGAVEERDRQQVARPEDLLRDDVAETVRSGGGIGPGRGRYRRKLG
ncbi:hypothetical protein QU38_01055, partial [Staphylococcus aureus]